jgi:hypothetical protein
VRPNDPRESITDAFSRWRGPKSFQQPCGRIPPDEGFLHVRNDNTLVCLDLPTDEMIAAALLALALVSRAQPLDDQRPQAILERAVADFQKGRLAESAAGFDSLARLVPESAPQLWQRGIALYYVGRYRDCRAQFESHRP